MPTTWGLEIANAFHELNDPEAMLYHHEPVWRDGKRAGYITSGNYGYFLGASIGLGYVKGPLGETGAEVLKSSFEIEVAGKRIPAAASLKPMYDPEGLRPKA